jgi:hypothetical protein
MTYRNNLKGNALVDFLILCIGIYLTYTFLILPYKAINSESNAELQAMMVSVKGSSFEPTFKAHLSDFMVDDKLSHSEFNELKDMINSYQTSIISGSQDKFAESKSAQLKADKEANENPQDYSLFFLISFMLIVSAIGFRNILSD